MMKRIAAMLPALILLSSASIAFAASADDTAFAAKAAQAGNAEVAEGEMAKTKATDPRVKEFAATMVKDHSAAGSELKDAASKAGITLPSGVSVEEKAAAERLGTFSGAEFDRNYMQLMVKDHKAAVELFQKEAKTGEDARLKAFAEKTLPTIQMHLQMAERLASEIK
jgi:putative membrane protein